MLSPIYPPEYADHYEGRALRQPALSVFFGCLLLLGMSVILILPACLCLPGRYLFFGVCLISRKVLLITSLVPTSALIRPCLRTSNASFFILPPIFLRPYAAAFFVLLEVPLNNASFRMSNPSSCIQDRLKAVRRAVEVLSEYNCSLSLSRKSMEAWSFSRPEGFLFPNFIRSPISISAMAGEFPKIVRFSCMQQKPQTKPAFCFGYQSNSATRNVWSLGF